MAKYIFETINREGQNNKGSIEAETIYQAAEKLKAEGNLVLSLKSPASTNFLSNFTKSKEKFSSLEKIIFTDHLAAMIKSGTPLTEALMAYKERDESKGIESVIDGLIKKVEKGEELSSAMELYPKIFSPLYCALIRSSEKIGNLDETLEYLANDLRREYEFDQRVKSALMYPALVVGVAFVVIVVLVVAVIPKITELTKSLGSDLPLITRIVSSFSSFLTAFGIPIIALLVLLIGLLFALLKNNKFKEKLDPYLLRVPLVGPLMKKYILARFLRIVGNCIKNGIPLTNAFATVGSATNNTVYKNACGRIEEKIVRGNNIVTAMSDEGPKLFPKIIIRMIRGAEKTGNIDEAMLRLSSFYENEVDRDLKRITTLIEPALTVFLGLLVGAIAISVIGPIYQMTSKIK